MEFKGLNYCLRGFHFTLEFFKLRKFAGPEGRFTPASTYRTTSSPFYLIFSLESADSRVVAGAINFGSKRIDTDAGNVNLLMARKWSNLNLPGALHFVTDATINRVSVFETPDHCKAFFEVLAELSRDWPSKLIAYVVMRDHIHLICNPEDGRIKEFVAALKSLSTKRVCENRDDMRLVRQTPDTEGSTHQLWQESFKAQPLWNGWMVWQKINYIHKNPVKAGLCVSAKDYPWSSFCAFYQMKSEPIAVDSEWWWPDDAEKLSKAMKELGWRSWEKRQ
jgi:REP element-mobilizing transposase RayT